MGQYYKIVLSDKDYNVKEVYESFTGGVKLMEFAYDGTSIMQYTYYRIFNNPMRVATVGDYTNLKNDDDNFNKVVNAAWGEDEEYAEKHKPDLSEFDETCVEGRYLLNHTKKEFVDLKVYKEVRRAINKMNMMINADINPLALLTATSNGLGGGDYHCGVNEYLCGQWQNDVIELTNTCPIGIRPSAVHYDWVAIMPVFAEFDRFSDNDYSFKPDEKSN